MLATFAIPLVLGALAPATRTDEPESWTELFASAGAPLAASARPRSIRRVARGRERCHVGARAQVAAVPLPTPSRLGSHRTLSGTRAGGIASKNRVLRRPQWLAGTETCRGWWRTFTLGDLRRRATRAPNRLRVRVEGETRLRDLNDYALRCVHVRDDRLDPLDGRAQRRSRLERDEHKGRREGQCRVVALERNSSAPSRPGPDPSRRTRRPGRVRARWIAAGARRRSSPTSPTDTVAASIAVRSVVTKSSNWTSQERSGRWFPRRMLEFWPWFARWNHRRATVSSCSISGREPLSSTT